MNTKKTPVLLITYNRADKTEELINILIKNNIDNIFIYMDGPKDSSDLEGCEKNKKIIKKYTEKYSNIKTLYKDKNRGLTHSIPEAIDWIFNFFDRAIILEDDCVPSKEFFIFMEKMLIKYKSNTKIASVCGSNFLSTSITSKESYFYSKYFNCWGWATWKDRWKNWHKLKANLDNLNKIKNNKFLKSYLGSYRAHLYWHWILNKKDTWDYFWNFTSFISQKLHVTPKINLISNTGIGLDSTNTKSYPVPYTPSNKIKSKFDLNLISPTHTIINHDFDNEVEDKIFSKSFQNRLLWFFRKIFNINNK